MFEPSRSAVLEPARADQRHVHLLGVEGVDVDVTVASDLFFEGLLHSQPKEGLGVAVDVDHSGMSSTLHAQKGISLRSQNVCEGTLDTLQSFFVGVVHLHWIRLLQCLREYLGLEGTVSTAMGVRAVPARHATGCVVRLRRGPNGSAVFH